MNSIIRSVILSVICALAVATVSRAQVQRDQDLVTLKNGYQILGYVIEQQPGKLIKVLRPDQNDTVEVAMADIAKLSKIWVQPFSEKKLEEKDSIALGRYNNKRHVFTLAYVLQVRDIEQHARKGIGFSWYRNYSNRYMAGLTGVVFSRQDPKPRISGMDPSATGHHFLHYQLLFSNQWRIGKPLQNRRISTLLTLHTGVVIERSEYNYMHTSDVLDVEYERAQGGWILQSGFALRVNPDSQSGFIIEPGFTLFPQNIRQYSGDPDTEGTVYLGFRRQVNHLATLKLSYFF